MTIAACYVSPEGIVFGADSTSTISIPGNPHYLNNAQKLFEIGESSTLGALTWGLGGLDSKSHRTLLALLGDDLAAKPATDVADVAGRWYAFFWTAYKNSPVRTFIDRCRTLNAKKPFVPDENSPDPQSRTQDEETELLNWKSTLTVGFCIGGYAPPARDPAAYEIVFDPVGPQPTPIPILPITKTVRSLAG